MYILVIFKKYFWFFLILFIYLQQVVLGQHCVGSGRGQLQGAWCSSQGCSRGDDGPTKIRPRLVRPEKEIEKRTDAVCHQVLHV